MTAPTKVPLPTLRELRVYASAAQLSVDLLGGEGAGDALAARVEDAVCGGLARPPLAGQPKEKEDAQQDQGRWAETCIARGQLRACRSEDPRGAPGAGRRGRDDHRGSERRRSSPCSLSCRLARHRDHAARPAGTISVNEAVG